MTAKNEMDATGANTMGLDMPGSAERLAVDVLARFPESAWIDEAAMGRTFGVTGRSIRRMVARGELPPAISLAGCSRWNVGRVRRWLDTLAEKAETDARESREREALERETIEKKQFQAGLI